MTGLMLTAPKGSKFWHPCADPAKGLAEMESIAFTYGAAWGHAETTIEFGESDGTTFVASNVVKAAAKPGAASARSLDDHVAAIFGKPVELVEVAPPAEGSPP